LTETGNVIGISKERTAHTTSLLRKVNITTEVGNCFLWVLFSSNSYSGEEA